MTFAGFAASHKSAHLIQEFGLAPRGSICWNRAHLNLPDFFRITTGFLTQTIGALQYRIRRKIRSSDSLVGIGVEIQPSAEEQDSSSKVGKGAETASRMFQTLNLGVEAFGQGIGDGVSKIG